MQLMRFLDQKVEEYRQFQHFWLFYKARLQHKEGTLPEFKVDFSTIGTEKPPTEEKEFYHFFIHFREEKKPNKNYFRIMALGSQLMNKLSLWKLTHPNKTLMDVAIAKATGKPFCEIVNIQLHLQCMVKAACYYKINQAIMDMIADGLISAWDTYSTNFVAHITVHNGCN